MSNKLYKHICVSGFVLKTSQLFDLLQVSLPPRAKETVVWKQSTILVLIFDKSLNPDFHCGFTHLTPLYEKSESTLNILGLKNECQGML